MTALLRHQVAATREDPPSSALTAWRRVEEIRREWLVVGLSTDPADRHCAEDNLASIYARLGRARPTFVWVDSPHAALPHLPGLPTVDDLHRWVYGRRPPGAPPLASDLAAAQARLQSELDAAIEPMSFDRPPPKRKKGEKWPKLPPPQALERGVPFLEVLRQGMRTSLANGFHRPVRAALTTDGPLPVAWYGQQDASWIAPYDALRRLRLARYPRDADDHLDAWAGLARSCGWWWPGERTCVVVERPLVVRTEAVPEGWHEQVRLAQPWPSVEYRDGWRPRLG